MATDDPKILAQEALTLKAIEHAVAGELAQRRAALAERYEALGIKSQEITDVNGDNFGSIVLPKARVSAFIVNEDNFLDWLERKHPEHLMKVTKFVAAPAYVKLLLDAAKKAGIGVDPDDGEALPFIAISVGERSITVTPTRDAREAVAKLLRNNGLFELEGREG